MNKFWYKIENDKKLTFWAKEFGSMAITEIEQSDSYQVRSKHFEKIQKGEWWSDEIRKSRNVPLKRLQLALESLPYPAAFREAAIALRALIREKRKQEKEFNDQLALLYQLAAIKSLSIPFSKFLKEPGFNVMETIPGGLLFKIPIIYKELGYKKLALLNKTDVKWIVENWGEPSEHVTLHTKYNNIWMYYENKLKNERIKRDEQFINELKSLLTLDRK